jgi:colanic acid/amylovoran biosynthesis protein
MNILIDSCSYNCQNVGDLSMLIVAVSRLHALHPHAAIRVITNAPEIVRRHCPDVTTVPVRGRRLLLEDRLLGRLGSRLPATLDRMWSRREAALRLRQPDIFARVLQLKQRAGRVDAADTTAFLAAIKDADLVVVSGAGIFTDAFRENVLGILATLELALRRGIPTAIVGHGFGPIEDRDLFRRVAEIIPHVGIITVRERLASVPFLQSVGASPERIVVTGDDAIELAYNARRDASDAGAALGVNLRLAPYAAVDRELFDVVRTELHAASRRHQAPLLGIPIAHHGGGMDVDTLQQLLEGADSVLNDPAPSDSPLNVIRRAGRCRVVVTGSYHGAVFALAQGVPVVALAKSRYYLDKMRGVADQFGRGCDVIALERTGLEHRLAEAIDDAWQSSDRIRPLLLSAASRQIDAARHAYRLLVRGGPALAGPSPAHVSGVSRTLSGVRSVRL